MIIDGLQYSNWSREVFEQLKSGGVTAIHATCVFHEQIREALLVLEKWNRLFARHSDLIMPVYSSKDIEHAHKQGRVGILLGAQNCSCIEDDIDMVQIMRDLHISIMQLSYNNQSLLACGCYEAVDSGVTRFGKQVIKEMNRLGMIVDMSHSGEKSTFDAIEYSERPIVISHANPLSFHLAKRNKSNDLLKALAESGGLLGLSLYPFHLKDGSDCSLESFCQMAADTAELMGVEHIGLGTDLCQNQPQSILDWMRDGRWTKERDYGEGSKANATWPKALSWFKDGRDFKKIEAGLSKVGFSSTDINKIMGKNWLNFLEGGLSEMIDKNDDYFSQNIRFSNGKFRS